MKSKKACLLIAFFIAIISLIGCERDPNSILGDNLHNGSDLTEGYKDTIFEIVAYSIPDTSLIIQNATRMLLGSTYDNVFGSAQYNMFSQLNYDITSSTEEFYQEYSVIDSVVLVLPYSGLYPYTKDIANGRTITLSIHELLEEILDSDDLDSVYTVSSSVSYDRSVLPGNEVRINLSSFDTIYDSVNGYSYIPPIRAHISKDFGRKLLTMPKAAYEVSNAFPDHYNGLYIAAKAVNTPQESSVASFAIGTGNEIASIEVYYDNLPDKEAVYKKFTFGPTRFTQVKRDFSTSNDMNFKAQMSGDTASGQQKLYLSSSGGSVIKFMLPNVGEVFGSDKIIINRAELIIPVSTEKNSSGMAFPKTIQIPDIADNSTDPGGSYKSSNMSYNLYITRQLQLMLYQDRTPEWMEIRPSVSERYGTPTMVPFNGPKANSGDKMRLRVIYTQASE